MEIFGPILISTLAGLSTVVGGLLVFLKIKKIDEFITFCLSFSLSVMISVSLIDLIPSSSFVVVSSYGYIVGFLILIMVFLFGNITINLINNRLKKERKNSNSLYRLGILSMFALMVHNFPEGIATFMSAYNDISLGISLGIAIMLHNIPEGISIAVPLYYATGKRGKGVLYSFISGLAEPLGAILAYVLLKNYITDTLISIVLIFVSGLMITLAISELFPKANKYNKPKYMYFGLLLGSILVIINHFIF